MKKLILLILIGFTLAIVATTAMASGNEYRDHRSDSDDDRYKYSERSRDDERHEYEKNYQEHERKEYREGKNEIYGTIQRIPQGGLGTWVIDQQEIFVDQKTRIENEYGRPRVGSRVKVEGIYQNGVFHAKEIETRK